MTERVIVPQRQRVTTSKRKELPRAERISRAIAIASPGEVHSVIDRMIQNGRTFDQACKDVGITGASFWRSALKSPELRKEVAAFCITDPWRALQSAPGALSPQILAVRAKLGREMAASLAPGDWGDKVQVESRQLVINTNLDFGVVERFEDVARGIGQFDGDRAVGTENGTDTIENGADNAENGVDLNTPPNSRK